MTLSSPVGHHSISSDNGVRVNFSLTYLPMFQDRHMLFQQEDNSPSTGKYHLIEKSDVKESVLSPSPPVFAWAGWQVDFCPGLPHEISAFWLGFLCWLQKCFVSLLLCDVHCSTDGMFSSHQPCSAHLAWAHCVLQIGTLPIPAVIWSQLLSQFPYWGREDVAPWQ